MYDHTILSSRRELTSRVLRLIDDLELLVDPEDQVIHVRFASRVGIWDFGVNRERVEKLQNVCAVERIEPCRVVP